MIYPHLIRKVLVILASVSVVLMLSVSARAEDKREITGIDPASVRQGETALLTITGTYLPVGTLVVEFFPQQIAVLDILASDENQVYVQVKVPTLAPAGVYNVLIYNHLGEEAFGEGLLTVESDIVTPVFKGYDPKVIAEATSGFAIILTGDSISPNVVEHLDMEWELGGKKLYGIQSVFSYGGSGTVVCAVTGKPPTGALRGRVLLNGTPIYLVEISVKSGGAMIIGHGPASVETGQSPYQLKLLGSGFSREYLIGLQISLTNGDMTVAPSGIELADSTTLLCNIAGNLEPGQYMVRVMAGTILEYEGNLDVTAPPEAPPVETTEPPGEPLDGQPEEIGSGDGAGTENAEATGTEIEEPVEAGPTPAIISVSPLLIPAGGEPCAFFIAGENLKPVIIERLDILLTVDGSNCALQFVGAAGNGFTCVFSPPEQIWPRKAHGTLSVNDPEGQLKPYSIAVFVEDREIEPRPVEDSKPEVIAPPIDHNDEVVEIDEPEPGTNGHQSSTGVIETQPAETVVKQDKPEAPVWEVDNAYIGTGQGASTLTVSLNMPQVDWDPALLKGSFTLLPSNEKYLSAFSNIATEGDLSFKRSSSGVPLGTYTGNFVSGDLLVSLSYDNGPAKVSVLTVDTDAPKARLIAPAVERLLLDADSGGLNPATLRWVIDFTPLSVTADWLVEPVCEPKASDQARSFSFEINGNQLVLVQDLAYWTADLGIEDGISVAFEPAVDLDWTGETSVFLPVDQPEIQEETGTGGLAITFARTDLVVDDQGFAIILIPSGEMPPIASFKAMSVSTDFLLLSKNLDKFSVSATSVDYDGTPAVRLHFGREDGKFDEAVYGIMVDQMVEAESVTLMLSWMDLKTSVTSTVSFTRRDPGGTGDRFSMEGLE